MHILYAWCSVAALCFVISLSSIMMHLSPAEIRQEGDPSNRFLCRCHAHGTWSDLTFHYNLGEERLIKRQRGWDLIFRRVPSKWFLAIKLSPIPNRWQQAGTPGHFQWQSKQKLGKPGTADRLCVYDSRTEVRRRTISRPNPAPLLDGSTKWGLRN